MTTVTSNIKIPNSTDCTYYLALLSNEISLKNSDYQSPSQCIVENRGWQHVVWQTYTYSLTEKTNEGFTQFPILSPYYLIEKIKKLVVLQKGVPEYILNSDIIPSLLLSILKEINSIVSLFGNSSIYFYKDYEDPNYQQLVLKITVSGSSREDRNAHLHNACNKLDAIIGNFKDSSLPEQKSIIDEFYYLFSIKFIS